MKKNILLAIFVTIGILLLVLLRTTFSDYNLKRTVSACIVAQKQTTKTFDIQKAKKFCKDEIKKKSNLLFK